MLMELRVVANLWLKS